MMRTQQKTQQRDSSSQRQLKSAQTGRDGVGDRDDTGHTEQRQLTSTRMGSGARSTAETRNFGAQLLEFGDLPSLKGQGPNTPGKTNSVETSHCRDCGAQYPKHDQKLRQEL